MDFIHTSVMLQETVAALDPRAGGRYVDCTSGGGGHTAALLEKAGPTGAVLGIDRDPDAIAHLEKTLGGAFPNLTLRQADFSRVDEVMAGIGWDAADGMVLDLGISSYQLEGSGRGFSFNRDEPLDMRMDPDSGPSAYDLVNRLPEDRLADLIFKYGDERASRRVARAIAWARKKGPISTSSELADIIRRALYKPGRRPRIDSATRTFQALRIAVNQELDALAEFLAKAPGLLVPGGRVAIISFHSLEDRLVKNAMIRGNRPAPDEGPGPFLKALSKKPLLPSQEEMDDNPRSRSAKLRVGERM